MSLKGMRKITGRLKFGAGSPSADTDWTKYDDRLVESVETDDVSKLKATLTKKGVCCTKLREDGNTALHIASMRGSLDCLRTMLKAERPDLTVTDFNGRTALHLAARGGHLNCMERLLECGVPVDFQDSSSMTSLHYAVSSGHKGCVDLLLKYNVPVNLTDKEGRSALFLAVQAGHSEIVDLLLENDSNINIQDNFGKTALMYACEYNQPDLARTLISKNAQVNISDFSGKSAATYALEKKHKDIIDMIQNALHKGSRKNIEDLNRNNVEYSNNARHVEDNIHIQSSSKEETVFTSLRNGIDHDIHCDTNGEINSDGDNSRLSLFPELEGTFLSSSFSTPRGSIMDSKEVANLKEQNIKLQAEVNTLKLKLDEANCKLSETGPTIPLVVYQQLKVDNDKIIRELNFQVHSLKEQVEELEEKNIALSLNTSSSVEEDQVSSKNQNMEDDSQYNLKECNKKLQEENSQLLGRILEFTSYQEAEILQNEDSGQVKNLQEEIQEMSEQVVESKGDEEVKPGASSDNDQVTGEEMGDAESKLPAEVVAEKVKYETSIKDLEQQNADLMTEAEDLKRKLKKASEEQESETKSSKNVMESIQAENKKLKEQLKENENQMPLSSTKENDDLQKEIELLKKENAKLKSSLTENGSVNAIENKENQKKEIESLKIRCNELNKELMKVKSQGESDYLDSADQISSMKREIQNLKDELSEAEEDRTEMKHKYDDQVEENRKQIDFYEGELSVLEDQLQSREERHAEVIHLYRSHLLAFYLGVEDEKLERVLGEIVKLRKKEVAT